MYVTERLLTKADGIKREVPRKRKKIHRCLSGSRGK